MLSGRSQSFVSWSFVAAAIANSALVAAEAVKSPSVAVKRIPPPGIVVPEDKRSALEHERHALSQELAQLESSGDKRQPGLAPDVRIFLRAVETAVADQEFYKEGEIGAAFQLLRNARGRIDALKQGQAPWTTAHGLVVRGYISRLDGSVQPYGLVVPRSYVADGKRKYRLDLWFHGRNEKLSEVSFIADRKKNVGTFAPADTIVLHPYGRYCNANKFAGEVDVLEAIDSVRNRYQIDDDQIVIRGFSMGGASTWHLAVHYPDRWAAANPGAGFAETPKFATHFHKDTLSPTWWERKLFHLYDCTDWAENLSLCPTVAYSGELDSQKQAADIMAGAMKKYSLELVHVIGPGTKHQYHPDARDEVDRRITALAMQGRNRFPKSIVFTTYSLKYNHCDWVTVDALDQHWRRARISAQPDSKGRISVVADNIKAFTIDLPPGEFPIRQSSLGALQVVIAEPSAGRGQSLPQIVTVKVPSNRPGDFTISFHREGDQWREGTLSSPVLRKKHGLQGPIDDAFMDAFVFVRPTGQASSPRIQAFVTREMDRAIVEWQRQFRGIPRVKDDGQVTADDIATKNLILWGDAAGNSVLARIIDKLPIRAVGDKLVAGGQTFASADHVPILIYPNPLNPNRYVVLNSGFTFRESAYRSNAYQIPKLPDWAIVDVRTPANADWPGKIAAADFFDENWQLGPMHVDDATATRE